jgi:hypothetical protein
MQEATPGVPTDRSAGRSRLRSWLIGCGLGCLGVLILGIAACTSFVVWLRQPGELLEPDRLFSARTRGYVEWTLTLEDPGTSEFVEQLFHAVRQEEQLDKLPGWARWLVGWQRRRDERRLRQMFPMVLAWTVRPAAGGQRDLQVGTVSVERLGNRLVLTDWALGLALRWSPEAEVEQYAGERIYRFADGDGSVFFLRGNDVFVTSDAASAREVIDLLAGRVAPVGDDSTEIRRLFVELDDEHPLRGVIGNEQGELARVWERLVGTDRVALSPAVVRAATLAGGFENARDFVGRLSLWCRDPASCRDRQAAIADALGDEFDRIDVEVTSEMRADWLDVELRIRDLPGAVERLFRFERFTER